jgi:2'-5' RNA ligase
MRLFLAIELPEEVRRHLDIVRDELDRTCGLFHDASWVKRENWHVTLKFLGEVPDAQILELTSALKDTTSDPISLFAERMVFFPKRGPVHVIAVEVGGEMGHLDHLHALIESRCEGLGFAKERRRFTGHITLARPRHGLAIRGATLANQFPGPVFVAREFVLMQSEPGPQGSIYTPLHRQNFVQS